MGTQSQRLDELEQAVAAMFNVELASKMCWGRPCGKGNETSDSEAHARLTAMSPEKHAEALKKLSDDEVHAHIGMIRA